VTPASAIEKNARKDAFAQDLLDDPKKVKKQHCQRSSKESMQRRAAEALVRNIKRHQASWSVQWLQDDWMPDPDEVVADDRTKSARGHEDESYLQYIQQTKGDRAG